MASRTSNRVWSNGSVETYCKIVAAELLTANVAHFQRKISSSGYSAHSDGSPSQLIRISGVLLYCFDGNKL
jgi:hypothetical protein